ncbi:MAG TPA: hypothetical protein VH439_17265 [Gemmatimonadales bacterium]|jgi:hypothetical protein
MTKKLEPVALLRAVIDSSGLSDRQWAMTVAWRDERTIRRWLAAAAPIPDVVLRQLRAIHARGNGTRGQ